MKKKLALILAGVMMLASLAACGTKGEQNITLATGGTSGTYYAVGGVLQNVLNDKLALSDLTVASTGASTANVNMITDGEAQMAILQSDVISYAHTGTNTFAETGAEDNALWVAGLYNETVQIIATPDITDVSQLAGKTVCMGDVGSGTWINAEQVLAAYGMTINDMDVMIGLGRETIGRMRDFSQLLLPVVATLTAATGQIGAATARQGITVLFSEVLLSAINGLLVPLVYAYVAVCCAYAAVGNEGLKRLAGMIRGAVTVALTGFVLVFVGYLSASGAIAGSADAAAVKTAKLAISRTVPVVGGVLSDAAETVLVGAGVLKGSVGAVGALVVLAICLVPFLQLGLHYLAYKGVAVVTGIAADMRLCKLIDEVGSAFGLVLGMTGSCALILLVSLVSAITAVSV